MPDSSQRLALLAVLAADPEVVAAIKAKIGASGVADLILEAVNPHRPLSTEEKAHLAGVSARTVRRNESVK